VLGAVKAEYREKLLTIQEAFEPPLRNSELSLGLDLEAPPVGASAVARFTSEAKRLRRVVPDAMTKAVVNRIMDGSMVIACRTVAGKKRRHVTVCLPAETGRLGPGWTVVSFGEPLPTNTSDQDWDDDGMWDLFGTEADPSAVVPKRAPRRPARVSLDAAAGEFATRPMRPAGTSRRQSDDDETRPSRAPAPFLSFPIAMGCMRLSTKKDRIEASQAVALLHAALDAGIRVLDTADAYALNADEMGHNERLIAKALETWSGPAHEVLVATKGGLTRPDGKWVPKGNKRYLATACEASLKALGVERIGLYQLHVPDPYVPITDSLAALVKLRDAGKIARIGVCNVSPFQLLDALEVVPDLASVQVPLSCFDASSVASGTIGVARDRDVPVMAYAPIGGWQGVGRAGRNRQLGAVASGHGATPHEVALAWLLSLDARVLPIVGMTQRTSLESSVRALSLTLGEDDIDLLDARFPSAAATRDATFALKSLPETASDDGEVVLLMGYPAAGKTTQVEAYTDRGYERLNRDLVGGRLKDLLPRLDKGLSEGKRRWVLDNTYPDRMARRAVLEVAREHGVPVTARWLQTSLQDAQVNAVNRMLDRYGKLLSPDEIKGIVKRDPNMFPPNAQFTYRRKFEEPTTGEGLSRVEPVPFQRRPREGHTNKALFLDYDGTLRTTHSGKPAPNDADDVKLLPNRREVLLRYIDDGYRLLGVSNQGGVHLGHLTDEQARSCIERTHELLDLPGAIEGVFCPHPPGAPKCWCRKPLPGWGVWFVRKYQLDPAACIMVGDRADDRGFAERNGFRFVDADEFFSV